PTGFNGAPQTTPAGIDPAHLHFYGQVDYDGCNESSTVAYSANLAPYQLPQATPNPASNNYPVYWYPNFAGQSVIPGQTITGYGNHRPTVTSDEATNHAAHYDYFNPNSNSIGTPHAQ